MKQMNRYYLVFGAWCVILAYAAFFSNNVYFNGFLLFFGFLGCVTAYAYINENENAKERKFSSKIIKKLGLDE